MSEQIKSIVILGGGTAGWLAANHLGYHLRGFPGSEVQVTLLESPDIPSIGVGEGTVPAIRNSLKKFGISELDMLKECQATFKQGIKFNDWLNDPVRHGPHHYYHPFDYPDIQSIDMPGHWLAAGRKERSFADYVSLQARMCEMGLAPKLVEQPEYMGAAAYAYHFDAGKFAELLASNAQARYGVNKLEATVVGVEKAEDGSLIALHTDRLGTVQADFFVDCSGFASRLLGCEMGVAFRDKGDQLLVDRALVVQCPYEDMRGPLPCVTFATARPSGWIWDIALQNRRGVGYVFASEFCSNEAAEQDFRAYLGDQSGRFNLRTIPMRIGYRDVFWCKNCVAIGLSQGFVEPLEATGLLMFDASASVLAELLPSRREQLEVAAQQFNEVMQYAWDRVIDFIKLHYCLSRRDDSDFWLVNRHPDTMPDSLCEQLARWRHRVPRHVDFPNIYSVFSLENYLYVMYGMDFETDLSGSGHRYLDVTMAQKRLAMRDEQLRKVTGKLPTHRELIELRLRRG